MTGPIDYDEPVYHEVTVTCPKPGPDEFDNVPDGGCPNGGATITLNALAGRPVRCGGCDTLLLDEA